MIALAAGVWHTLIMLGELLHSDGVAGCKGVAFSGAGLASLGLSCQAMYQSRSSGVMSSPRSGPAIQNASQCPPCSRFLCQ